MLIEVPDKVAKMTVIKRDGKKVEFNGAKIALAIQKGFWDITGNEDVLNAKYNETDINKVYSKVLGRIEKREAEKIKIEEIQDLIEEELKNNKMIEKVSQEANGLPTFGHLSVDNMFGMDYEAVKPEDIPNFLDESWAIKEEESTDGEE